MTIGDLVLDKTYQLDYDDPNYPCHCPCHNGNSNVIHFAPCCYDYTYHGIGVCRGHNAETNLVLLRLSNGRMMWYNIAYVSELPSYFIDIRIRYILDLRYDVFSKAIEIAAGNCKVDKNQVADVMSNWNKLTNVVEYSDYNREDVFVRLTFDKDGNFTIERIVK